MYCLEENELENINSLPLAKAYIPKQKFSEPVSPENALKMGTAWQELYMPEVVK